MSMSRKDYTAIAKVLHENMSAADGPEARAAVVLVARDLMNYFWQENHRFDGNKFLEATRFEAFIRWSEGMTHKEALLR